MFLSLAKPHLAYKNILIYSGTFPYRKFLSCDRCVRSISVVYDPKVGLMPHLSVSCMPQIIPKLERIYSTSPSKQWGPP